MVSASSSSMMSAPRKRSNDETTATAVDFRRHVLGASGEIDPFPHRSALADAPYACSVYLLGLDRRHRTSCGSTQCIDHPSRLDIPRSRGSAWRHAGVFGAASFTPRLGFC